MTSLILFAKKNLGQLPYPAGWTVAQLPFTFRPGIAAVYRARRQDLKSMSELSLRQKQEFIFARVQAIAAAAYKNVPFYADLYLSKQIDPTRFRHFDDLQTLPIVTKRDLQNVPLSHRSGSVPARSLENTGGSSGQPLSFYVEPSSIPHEWAHMHEVWRKVGYHSRDLKIAFSGRSSVKDGLDYDAVRHHYAVDIYAGWEVVANRIMALPFYARPKFLHGYPSAVFDFIRWLDSNGHPLLPILRKQIKGLLLGSEYPAPGPRAEVEQLLNCSSVSWYGHTERTILAYERAEKSRYSPFLSYGFTEAVTGPEGQRLIGTSYYNRASPLIRYDTGDLVEAEVDGGILDSFTIKHGRDGDFVLDKEGRKIFLTGLIFGRHHKIFDHVNHIQVGQMNAGQVTIFFVPKTRTSLPWADLFDSSNVLLDFDFKAVEAPYRTNAGKVPLLVKQERFSEL